MTKLQLISELANQSGITKEQSKEIVGIFFDVMGEALARGDRVEIRGLCAFSVKEYDGYIGRNPKTGEVTTVAPKRLPKFKAGKDLKERVDG